MLYALTLFLSMFYACQLTGLHTVAFVFYYTLENHTADRQFHCISAYN